ncbi:serine hydrolase domain-containing protein [Nonomuraea aurantiaca]|uniref:serine hydrolase domain-containing protein n=1 Tax=Nonomuraea aurantiaca TaxID=2878562 RepID=UPI001CD9DB13|nr:serine hydrolase domain-containing protein [Nonomuraea aurantiaca]MCA2226961.1 beta-lactamase family protein [Nonomuraea aurantiaca]
MATLVSEAGYRSDEPIVVGMRQGGTPPVLLAHGLSSTGGPVTAATLAYAASLSKQMTAACAALLAQRGVLDMESALSRWLPRLPAWAGTIRLRHLVHHTAALPADSEIDAIITGDDRTTPGIIQALARFPALDHRPGTEHVYSNAGYVCLAAVVERAADMPLPDFAQHHLFVPLAMADSRYWPGPDPTPPGAAPLARLHPAPLSLGDGGVWTTLRDLLRWGQALNADELGVSGLMQTPGRLDDGTPIDYAWGIGVRSHAGHRVYRHGGGWTGLRALHARVPDLDLSVALLAIDDHTERRVPLLDSLLDEVTGLHLPSKDGQA